MIQDLITYTLVFAASGVAIYQLYRFVVPAESKKTSGCSSGCAGCGLKQMKINKDIIHSDVKLG